MFSFPRLRFKGRFSTSADSDPAKILKEKLSSPKLSVSIGALGVVFGDIGTSPLYAVKECFFGPNSIKPIDSNVFGVVSLIFWSLTIVVSVKYVVFILRADNNGEGGIFALLSLLTDNNSKIGKRIRATIALAAILGAALLYGDGIITPAISVLSAIEGINVATTATENLVIPLTCLVLFLLFIFQRKGTSNIGKVFGPVMMIWFITISFFGINSITKNPNILLAVNPMYAYKFFNINHMHGMIVLGSVVLCITGGEALYADLGHFGRSPIRFSWLAIAFPSLLCNYFGQGALLLTRPNLAINPFYGLVPKDLLYPMVAIATIATVIASQALISGVFSLTRQAIQLGYIPRMRILHTSIRHSGQIYISKINYALMLACIGIVLYFRSSSHLAAAYGIAVTATMCITTIIYFFVVTYQWQWPLWKSIPPIGIFLFFDLTYFTTNLLKVFYGGWFTLIVAALIVIIMATWKDGRMELSKKLEAQRVPLDVLLDDLKKHDVHRVNGTAVFMTLSPIGIPSTLLHHLKHNKVLHEKIVLLSIQSVDVPYIQSLERIKTEKLEQGFFRIIARYGFMESPNVPDIMELSVKEGLPVDKGMITYYLGRETLITTGPSKMMRWRKSLFSFLSRNAQTPAYFFGIPPGSVVEIGTQVML